MMGQQQQTTGTTMVVMTKRTLLVLAAIVGALLLSSTAALAITKGCQAEVECVGTADPDTLNGSAGDDYAYGLGSAETLKGFGGGDELYGQGGADKLFGGLEADYLIGGPGVDTLSGGAGPDTYWFGPSWGKESITEDATTENSLYFRQGPNEETPVTDNLTIKLFPGEGPEVTNAGGTSTLNWEGNPIRHVTGGSGDDRITGNYLPNSIHGGSSVASSGADNISTGGGDDGIRVADGVGDDVVDCGENFDGSDNDHVYYDAGDQIAANCENKHGPA